MKLRYRQGAAAPGPPAGGGRVIAFKWPGRSTPPKIIPATPLQEMLYVYIYRISILIILYYSQYYLGIVYCRVITSLYLIDSTIFYAPSMGTFWKF